MTDTPAPRRLWPRLVLWTVLVLLLAAGAAWGWAWSVRRAGLERNRAVLASLASYGLPTSASAFVAALPESDPALQARYKAWDAAMRADPRPAWVDDVVAEVDARCGRRPPVASASAGAVARAAADLDALAVLLAAGRLQLGAHGWLRTEFPDIDHAPWDRLATCTVPWFVAVRAGMAGFAARALAAGDPAPALADLGRMRAALAHPAFLIDAMDTIAQQKLYDDVLLALEREGRLPAAVRDTWLAEGPAALRCYADGLRGEWALFQLALNRAVVEGGVFAGDPAAVGIGSDPGLRLATWIHGPGDMAVVLGWMAAWERANRDGVAAPRPDVADEQALRRHGSVVGIIAPSLDEGSLTALLADNTRRLRQLAVRLLVAARERGALPADEAAAVALLGAERFAEGPARCRLRYELLAPRRFRVWFDPAVAPGGWPAAVVLPRLAGPLPTAKAAARPLLTSERYVEAELP